MTLSVGGHPPKAREQVKRGLVKKNVTLMELEKSTAQMAKAVNLQMAEGKLITFGIPFGVSLV